MFNGTSTQAEGHGFESGLDLKFFQIYALNLFLELGTMYSENGRHHAL